MASQGLVQPQCCYFKRFTPHLGSRVWKTRQSLIATFLMLLQEWAHIISLRWYAPSVLWLSWSIKTSPVDLFRSAWVGLCVQLQAEREMTNLFLEDKSLSFLTFPLVWHGGKKEKRNWLALLVLSFRLFLSLSFFHFLSLTTRPSFALLTLLDSVLLLHPRWPLLGLTCFS